MSPYRVLVQTKYGTDVMSAMLSTDKITGSKNIYILCKFAKDIKETDQISPKMIAHMQSGKRNSNVLANYRIYKEDDRSYDVRKVYYTSESGSVVDMSIGYKEYTQSDCLKAAMNHFVHYNGYKILQDL